MILFFSHAVAATLSGTVTTTDGTPLASVDVVAYDTRLSYATARTTSTGAYAMGMLPPGRYRMRALPPDSDPRIDRFLPDTWDFCQADVIEVTAGDSVEGLDASLPEGGRLEGRVVSSTGTPIASAQVLAIGQSERTSLVSRLTTTDSAGEFSLVGLDSEPGASEPYAVYVSATGWPRQYLAPSYDEDSAALFDVTRGETATTDDQALLDGIYVTGTVRGPDGPVTSGSVYVYSSSQVLVATIAEDGTYVGDGLPPGEVIPWASSTGYATTYYPDADRPGERIAAPEEGDIVTDADLALPLEDTLTLTLTGEGDLSEASVLLYNDTYTVGRGGGLDEAGSITIGALHPGSYYVYVYGSDVGYTDDFARDANGDLVTLTVDGDSAATLEMPAGSSFTGTIVGDDGEPVYGAYVYATTADGEDTVVGVADSDGVYTITGLAGGGFTLRASYAHYCPNDPGWVTVWWPEELVQDDAVVTELAVGEHRTDVDFVLPRDDDHDAMGDTWERDNGLDATRDDAGEDPDGDGYLNIEEWLAGTDPTDESLALDGCGSGCASGAAPVGGAALLFMLPLVWSRRRSAACTGTPRARALR